MICRVVVSCRPPYIDRGSWAGSERVSWSVSGFGSLVNRDCVHSHERENRELGTIIYPVMNPLESIISRLERVD